MGESAGFLLDEPTQGVDVGARQNIFAALDKAAKDGVASICASTDCEQLSRIYDRVLVFARGRIVSEVTGKAITKERIAAECLHGVSPGTAGIREGADVGKAYVL
jgi:ribose transport system ATP-binding protein